MPGVNSFCGYCPNPRQTRDHVIPKNLFVEPLPVNMITVPCCGECNGKKSAADQFLRDFLVCDREMVPHPVARQIWEKYDRARTNHNSELWKAIESRRNQMFGVKLNGVDFGSFLDMPIGSGPLKDALDWITKGLYFAAEKKRLPAESVLLAGFLGGPMVFAGNLRDCQSRGQVSGGCRGGDVFCFFSQSFVGDDPGEWFQYWGFAFYNAVYMSTMAVSPKLARQLPARWLREFAGRTPNLATSA